MSAESALEPVKRQPATPMSPLEKALTWHKLQAWRNPHDRDVHHVDAILAELERLKASQPVINVSMYPPAPDPALVAKVRQAYDGALQRRFIAVALDVEDVQHLLELFEPNTTGRARSEER